MSLVRKVILSIAVLFSIAACSDTTTSRTKVLGGAAYIEMPDSFRKMTAEMLKVKYSDQTPEEAYSVEDTTASFVFNLKPNKVSESQLQQVAEILKVQYAKFSPRISQEIIDEKTVFILKMDTPTQKENIKNIIVLTSLNDNLTIISFNVTEGNEGKYYVDGEKALMSLKWK